MGLGLFKVNECALRTHTHTHTRTHTHTYTHTLAHTQCRPVLFQLLVHFHCDSDLCRHCKRLCVCLYNEGQEKEPSVTNIQIGLEQVSTYTKVDQLYYKGQ